MLGISAARRRPRNSHTTSTTNPDEISRVSCASDSVARMPGERSITIASSASAGISARNCGSCALIASMVCTMLAPLRRLTIRITAGRSLWKPLL